MKLKAKGNNEQIIEKFNAQSCKTAKYAKSVVKKRETSELKVTGGGGTTTNAGDATPNIALIISNNELEKKMSDAL